MHPTKGIFALLFCVSTFLTAGPLSAETTPFLGEINEDNINVRTDSTTSAEVICTLNKGDYVEVLSQAYEWYKIKLPQNAPSFVKKALTSPIDERTASISGSRVNIRLRPETGSPIVGRAEKEELITLVNDEGEWYKIEPVINSFGWLHKKFVNKAPEFPATPAEIQESKTVGEIVEETKETEEDTIEELKKEEEIREKPAEEGEKEVTTLEGIVKPYGKVFGRKATHKLILPDKKVILLRGDKEELDNISRRMVKVTGVFINSEKDKYPILEVTETEVIY